MLTALLMAILAILTPMVVDAAPAADTTIVAVVVDAAPAADIAAVPAFEVDTVYGVLPPNPPRFSRMVSGIHRGPPPKEIGISRRRVRKGQSTIGMFHSFAETGVNPLAQLARELMAMAMLEQLAKDAICLGFVSLVAFACVFGDASAGEATAMVATFTVNAVKYGQGELEGKTARIRLKGFSLLAAKVAIAIATLLGYVIVPDRYTREQISVGTCPPRMADTIGLKREFLSVKFTGNLHDGLRLTAAELQGVLDTFPDPFLVEVGPKVEDQFQVRDKQYPEALEEAGLSITDSSKVLKRLGTLNATPTAILDSNIQIEWDADGAGCEDDGDAIRYDSTLEPGQCYFAQGRTYGDYGMGKMLWMVVHGTVDKVVSGIANLKKGLYSKKPFAFEMDRIVGPREAQIQGKNPGKGHATCSWMLLNQFVWTPEMISYVKELIRWTADAAYWRMKYAIRHGDLLLLMGSSEDPDEDEQYEESGPGQTRVDRDIAIRRLKEAGVSTTGFLCLMSLIKNMVESWQKPNWEGVDVSKGIFALNAALKKVGAVFSYSCRGKFFSMRKFVLVHGTTAIEAAIREAWPAIEEIEYDKKLNFFRVASMNKRTGKLHYWGIHKVHTDCLPGFPRGVKLVSDSYIKYILKEEGGADLDGDEESSVKTQGTGYGWKAMKDGSFQWAELTNPTLCFRHPIGPGEGILIEARCMLVKYKPLKKTVGINKNGKRDRKNIPPMPTPTFREFSIVDVPEGLQEVYNDLPWVSERGLNPKSSSERLSDKRELMDTLGEKFHSNMGQFMFGKNPRMLGAEITVDVYQQEIGKAEFFAWAAAMADELKATIQQQGISPAGIVLFGWDPDDCPNIIDGHWFDEINAYKAGVYLEYRDKLCKSFVSYEGLIEGRLEEFERLLKESKTLTYLTNLFDTVMIEKEEKLKEDLLSDKGWRALATFMDAAKRFVANYLPGHIDAIRREFRPELGTICLWIALNKAAIIAKSVGKQDVAYGNAMQVLNDLHLPDPPASGGFDDTHPLPGAFEWLMSTDVDPEDPNPEGDGPQDEPDTDDSAPEGPVEDLPQEQEPDTDDSAPGDKLTVVMGPHGEYCTVDELADYTAPPPAPEKEPEVDSANPLVAAGVKPDDKSGHCAKDIAMAEMATQFIGMEVAHSNNSMTKKYRLAWGARANTTYHRTDDIVMVSGSGNWGRVTIEDCKKVFIEHYVMHLMAACIAKCRFVVGNASGVDEMVRTFLLSQGYIEHPRDGFGLFSLRTMFDPKGSDIVVDIDHLNEKVENEIVINEGSDSDPHGLGDSDPVSVSDTNPEEDVSEAVSDPEELVEEFFQEALLMQKAQGLGIPKDQYDALTGIVLGFLAGKTELILNGAAGCGKTFLVKLIVDCLKHVAKGGHRVFNSVDLCSFTGTAQLNLRKATGMDACTIHTLIGVEDVQGHLCLKKQVDPAYRALIVNDEATMTSPLLGQKLRKLASGQGSAILWVGDMAQLPPVLPEFKGKEIHRWLHDREVGPEGPAPIMESGIERFHLTTNFRQAKGGTILAIAKIFRSIFMAGWDDNDDSRNGRTSWVIQGDDEAGRVITNLINGSDQVERGTIDIERLVEDPANNAAVFPTNNAATRTNDQCVNHLGCKSTDRDPIPVGATMMISVNKLAHCEYIEDGVVAGVDPLYLANGSRVKVVAVENHGALNHQPEDPWRTYNCLRLDVVEINGDGKVWRIYTDVDFGNRYEQFFNDVNPLVLTSWSRLYNWSASLSEEQIEKRVQCSFKMKYGWAMTIHKSQGLGFDRVYTTADVLYGRYSNVQMKNNVNLSYTAITRAKAKIILVAGMLLMGLLTMFAGFEGVEGVAYAASSIVLPAPVQGLVEKLKSAGAKAYLVGGAVLDIIQGNTPKDWDIEVHGVSMSQLEGILGVYDPKECGQSFGIFKIPAANCGGYDVDVSVPRRESRVGISHTDFLCDFDPNMTPEEAALRRDFTINAMFYDMDSGEIIDPYNGMEDLKNGVLRMTCLEKFIEDPLRALRAMQLVARKCKTIDITTLRVIREMRDSFSSLAPERVYEEFKKLLLMADKPSVGLEFLRDSGWLACFPQLHDLAYWPGWDEESNESFFEQFGDAGCPHNPEWHPEGSVWIHTLMVVDNAASVRHHVPEEDRMAFMLGALCHDLGKAVTTVLPECRAHGHEEEGVALTEDFLSLMTNEKKVIKLASNMVRWHMTPFSLIEAGDGAWKRLHGEKRMDGRLDLLGWLSRCDWAGRPNRTPWPTTIEGVDFDHVPSKLCLQWHEDLGVEQIKPVIGGQDLLDEGLPEGPWIGEGLAAAFAAQIEDTNLTESELLDIARKTAGFAWGMALAEKGEGKSMGIITFVTEMLNCVIAGALEKFVKSFPSGKPEVKLRRGNIGAFEGVTYWCLEVAKSDYSQVEHEVETLLQERSHGGSYLIDHHGVELYSFWASNLPKTNPHYSNDDIVVYVGLMHLGDCGMHQGLGCEAEVAAILVLEFEDFADMDHKWSDTPRPPVRGLPSPHCFD